MVVSVTLNVKVVGIEVCSLVSVTGAEGAGNRTVRKRYSVRMSGEVGHVENNGD